MSNYRRLYIQGGVYFFTAVTFNREPLFCEPAAVSRLKESFRYVVKKYPFKIIGLVILPDHLHCIWELPNNDHNYSLRWNLIKRYFSIGFNKEINQRREKNIWQRRFWEHCIRDETDLNHCLNYIHYNPVKHGYVTTPYEWNQSTFRRYVQRGVYDKHWGSAQEPVEISKLLLE